MTVSISESERSPAARIGQVLFKNRGWLPVPFLAVPLLVPGQQTSTTWAAGLLLDWERVRHHFWQICPKEMLTRLQHPLDDTPQREAAE